MSSASHSSSSSINVFQLGKYTVSLFPVNPQSSTLTSSPLLNHSLTVPLLIATPTEEGEFPILVFLHGFLLENSFYSQLIQHIASHGFIVIAPQLPISGEIESAKGVTEWLSVGLCPLLPPVVRPNLSKAALGGHSRGGKIAFGLALSYNNNPGSNSDSSLIKYSALVGIDPVEGLMKGIPIPPLVLTYVPHSFDLDMAALVVGSGLGEIKRNPLFFACAPKGVNHEEFYSECRSPACHFVVKDYGHMDTLDDETKGIKGAVTHCACKNGKSREPMRSFVGGITVAFMKAYLEGDDSYLNAIKHGKDINLPVQLQTVEFL
ncbi:hypothetical protein MKX03_012112 [Papaver bracteatum]|nr:hypothetical protein MKX03_012112 [Papaver bracteatum]